jgi:hypothetical protein
MNAVKRNFSLKSKPVFVFKGKSGNRNQMAMSTSDATTTSATTAVTTSLICT